METLALFLILCVNLCIVHINAVYDAESIRCKWEIDHFRNASLYVLDTIIITYVFLTITGEVTAVKVLKCLPIQFAIRWIYFDLMLNKLRELPYWYISNKVDNNSHIDTVLYKFKEHQYTIKIVNLIISIVCLIH